MAGLAIGAGMGAGAADKDEWTGQPENFNLGSESVRLHLPTRPQALSGSQPLLPGPAMEGETTAPPVPGEGGIPLSDLLPAYTRRAEEALDAEDIPPSERARVRRYFEAMEGGGQDVRR